MRNALLALLAEGSTHGYELKLAFERVFGAVWGSINVGQIYTTLGRLQRDGLVRSQEVEQSGRPDKRVYEITDEGRTALAQWLAEPVEGARLKDEFFMKLMLAALAGGEPVQLLDRQRTQYLQSLRDLDALALETEADSPTQLLIEGAMLHLQADLRWLDRCEERIENGFGGLRAAFPPAKGAELNATTGDNPDAAKKEAGP
jgi:DNA-binding PadR family transcriptional regulator